jgi:hypothetical protein
MDTEQRVPYEELREANMRRNLKIMSDLGITNVSSTIEAQIRQESSNFFDEDRKRRRSSELRSKFSWTGTPF